MAPIHWDDLREFCFALDPLRGRVTPLGDDVGAVEIGVGRWRPEPGCQTTPAHVEGGEEEIAFVLAGDGAVWMDGVTHAVGPGDTVVFRIDEGPHTFVGGDDGLDVLIFGERASRGQTTWLPRAGTVRVQDTWVDAGGGDHPWRREVQAGRVPLGEPAPRPERIVALDEVEVETRRFAETDIAFRRIGAAAGALRTGLRHIEIAPGAESAPPHVHTAEEELFVVVGGEGACVLGGERFDVRPGSIVTRPAGTGVAHSFAAGPSGLTLLAYGQRDPRDVCWCPRTNELLLRGAGIRFTVSEARPL